jgi:hypothetical protein
MNVYKKLTQARLKLLTAEMKKSGHNKFAGYHYFELGDFIPSIHKIFDELGLCGVFTFENSSATLTIHDTDGNGSIVFSSPVVSATKVEKDGTQKPESIQDMGGKHTYFRRYLWLMALEITEHDSIDAGDNTDQKTDKPEGKPVNPLDAVVQNVTAKSAESVAEPAVKTVEYQSPSGGQWALRIPNKPDYQSVSETQEEWLSQFNNIADAVMKAGKLPPLERINKLQALRRENESQIARLVMMDKAKFLQTYSQRIGALEALHKAAQ